MLILALLAEIAGELPNAETTFLMTNLNSFIATHLKASKKALAVRESFSYRTPPVITENQPTSEMFKDLRAVTFNSRMS